MSRASAGSCARTGVCPAFKHLPVAITAGPVLSLSAIRRSTAARPENAWQWRRGIRADARARFELEAGIFIGADNAPGSHSMRAAPEHIFGLCLLNDWSARDIQRWESFPLGPFLGKSFCTTISPWIVTSEALAPFRVPAAARAKDDPLPQNYLQDTADRAEGAFDIELSATIQTAAMRSKGQAPARITRTNLNTLYWTAAQMIAHHTCNGCNLSRAICGPGRRRTDRRKPCLHA